VAPARPGQTKFASTQSPVRSWRHTLKLGALAPRLRPGTS
jgi:hypothetical protein